MAKWSPNKLLSYNNMVMGMVIGYRTSGKTTGMLLHAYKKWKKNHKPGMGPHDTLLIVRRRKEALSNIKPRLMENVQGLMDHEFEYKSDGKYGYIRPAPASHLDEKEKKKLPWNLFCVFTVIGEQENMKGMPLETVTYIMFDEFILENQDCYYVANEANMFLQLCSTVMRLSTGRCKVFLFANAYDDAENPEKYFYNPYFKYWGITRQDVESNEITKRKKGAVLLEMFTAEQEDIDEMMGSDIAAIAGEEYLQMAMYNKFSDINNANVKPNKPKHFVHYLTLTNNSIFIDIYKPANESAQDSFIWVKEGDGSSERIMKLNKSVINENAIFDSGYLAMLKELAIKNTVYYNTLETRALFYESLKI